MKLIVKLIILLIPLISCCSSESQLIKTYEILFEPVKENNLITYYVSGLPMGASSINNFNIIFNLQPTQISGDDCLRLWFFIQNNSDQEVLFEPSQEFKLYFWKKNSKYEVSPESPLKMLKDIEQEKQVNLITQTIATALKSVSTTNTKITNNANENQIEINDSKEKIEKINSELTENINNIENWYNLYSESFNQGVLRRNTLFPNQSVNGYIYFKLPVKYKLKKWGNTTIPIENGHIEFEDIKNYEVKLEGEKLLIGKSIKFIIVKGE